MQFEATEVWLPGDAIDKPGPFSYIIRRYNGRVFRRHKIMCVSEAVALVKRRLRMSTCVLHPCYLYILHGLHYFFHYHYLHYLVLCLPAKTHFPRNPNGRLFTCAGDQSRGRGFYSAASRPHQEAGCEDELVIRVSSSFNHVVFKSALV